MAWTETGPASGMRAVQKAAALRGAIEARPGDPQLHAALGAALLDLRRFGEAAEAYEAAARIDPADFADWRPLAICLLGARRAADALELCDRRWPGPEGAGWHHSRGRALARLGRIAEARAEYARAIELGDPALVSLRAMLQSIAREGDGVPLLDFCESVDARYRDTAAIRAYRAAALSMTGRTGEARALIDLDSCVVRVPFDPPPEFGGIAAFNRALAEAILQELPPSPRPDDPDMNYAVAARDSTPLAALRSFIRAAVADYVARLDQLGLAGAMPPPPEHARLTCGAVVLRRDGRNKQHVHTTGYVSTVYHVRAPALDGNRGALALGPCDELTGGHRGCWGERYLDPRAGWLTIIPSHVFHDVVPTGSDTPRISVISDLCPLPPGATADQPPDEPDDDD
jgi:tetratricopeptide (TPR) repeat protein